MDTADIEAKVIQFIATKVENLDISTIKQSFEISTNSDLIRWIRFSFCLTQKITLVSTSIVKKLKDLPPWGILLPTLKNTSHPSPIKGPDASGMASDREVHNKHKPNKSTFWFILFRFTRRNLFRRNALCFRFYRLVLSSCRCRFRL